MISVRRIKKQGCNCSKLKLNTDPWEKSWRLKHMPNKSEPCNSRLWDVNVDADGKSYGDRSIGVIEGKLCDSISWLKMNGKWHQAGTCGVVFDATYLTPHEPPIVFAKL